jgi:hypothetical protein
MTKDEKDRLAKIIFPTRNLEAQQIHDQYLECKRLLKEIISSAEHQLSECNYIIEEQGTSGYLSPDIHLVNLAAALQMLNEL